MRKWVIGIALICLLSIATQEVIESIRPVRPDEELIVNAIFKPEPSGIVNRIKFDPGPSYVFDEWMDTKVLEPERRPGQFDKILNDRIDSTQKLVGIFEVLVAKHEGSEKDVESDRLDLQLQQADLSKLLAIKGSIQPGTGAESSSRRFKLKDLKLDRPIELFPKSQWQGAGTFVKLPTGKFKFVSYVDDLVYPVFSKDRQFACVASYSDFVNLFTFYFLQKTRRSWRVVVATI